MLVGAVLLFMLEPAIAGYHVGFNSATDTECLSRVVQWCKGDGDSRQPATSQPGPATGVDGGTYTDPKGTLCPPSDVGSDGFCLNP